MRAGVLGSQPTWAGLTEKWGLPSHKWVKPGLFDRGLELACPLSAVSRDYPLSVMSSRRLCVGESAFMFAPFRTADIGVVRETVPRPHGY